MGKSKTKTTTDESSQTKPLDWQEGPLKGAFNTAQGIYNQQSSDPNQPNWNVYSTLNDTEKAALSNAGTNSVNQSNMGNTLMNTGTGLLSNSTSGTANMGTAANTAAQFANGGFNQGSTTASNAVASNAGAYGNQGLTNLQNAFNLANTDATAQNTADATAYANSSGVQNAIKAANAYADQMYQRTTGTDLNAQAVAGGNLNSSRAGAASAVYQALQNAQDENNAATMYQNAYNTGLSTAEQARQSNMSGLLNGAATGISGANSGVEAQQAGNAQVNANNATQQNGASILSNIGSYQVGAASTGSNIASQGVTLQNIANTAAYNAGKIAQDDQNNANKAAVEGYQAKNQNQWAQLDNLYNIIGGTTWGGNSTGHSTSTVAKAPSTTSMIQGAIGSVGSLAGGVGLL